MPFFSSFTGVKIRGSVSQSEEVGGGDVVEEVGGGGGGYVSPGNSLDFSTSATTLEVTIDNPNPPTDGDDLSRDDLFGSALAISDRHVFVGAYQETDPSGYTEAGRAYVFDSTSGAIIYNFEDPDIDGYPAGDEFARSVSISHNFAVAGAAMDGGVLRPGRAWVFDLALGNVAFALGNPNLSGSSNYDFFGSAVGNTDTYAIIGAAGEGAAYIYNLVNPELLYSIANPNVDGYTGDAFGESVAISDTYAIVGAKQEDTFEGDYATSRGAAYVYDLSDGSLLYSFFGENGGDLFGHSVAIKDSIAVVGAPRTADGANARSGSAYIYDLSDGSLMHTLTNPNAYGTSAYDSFGWSVSINDTYVVVGAPYEDRPGNNSSGYAYVFDIATGNLVNTISNPNAFGTEVGDFFGGTVAISDTHLTVGAQYEDDAGGTSSGKVYLYSGS